MGNDCRQEIVISYQDQVPKEFMLLMIQIPSFSQWLIGGLGPGGLDMKGIPL